MNSIYYLNKPTVSGLRVGAVISGKDYNENYRQKNGMDMMNRLWIGWAGNLKGMQKLVLSITIIVLLLVTLNPALTKLC